MKTAPLYLAALVALLTSCDDAQLQALQRQKMEADAKSSVLQIELDKAKEELKAASGAEELKGTISKLEAELTQAKQALSAAEAAPKTPPTLPEKALELSWLEGFDAGKYAVLFDGQKPNVTTEPIVMPDAAKVYSRKVVLSNAAKSVPVIATADATGKWTIPNAETVASLAVHNSESVAAVKPAPQPQPFQPAPNAPPAGVAANPPPTAPPAGNPPPVKNTGNIPPADTKPKNSIQAKLQDF